jgi:hypothetical protein
MFMQLSMNKNGIALCSAILHFFPEPGLRDHRGCGIRAQQRDLIVMKNLKFHLLAATAVASAQGTLASAAQAQILLPPAELHGVGASLIINTRVRNCIGNPGNHVAGDIANNRLNAFGTNRNQLIRVAPSNFQPTSPTASDPAFDCETQEIQPDFQGKYVSTGSGFGRQMWHRFSNQFTNGFGSINPFGTWNNVQFAFSEAPATISDITSYNANANNATNKAGAAVQLPFFVVPIAFAYNPVYGVKQTGSGPINLTFRITVPASINGVVSGGLRLSRSDYCKIFNGEITNWNDPALKIRNGNQDLRDLADDASRWSVEGVPIRLVGRIDRSGSTNLLTRHLAAVCTGLVALNKYAKAAESLPYDNTSPRNMSGFHSDTHYFPGSSSTNFSGTVQSISGAFYERGNDTIDTTQGSEAAGEFMLTNGASGVAKAIETTGNNTLHTSTVDPNVKLNGKFGYVEADWVMPTLNHNLFSAALQKGSTTTFVMPSAENAIAAFGTILPPQTTATTGAYNITDGRTVYKDLTNTALGTETVDRGNPLHWANVLYPPSGATLATPANGYPVTGPAFIDTYTCFATPATRLNLVEYIALTLGKITKKSDNTPLSSNTFKGTGATALGIFYQSNIAPLPGAWMNAVNETFLKKSTQDGDPSAAVAKLGDRNLWIQDKLPLKATDIDGINSGTNTEVLANPSCIAGFGA